MAHIWQQQFVQRTKELFPESFHQKTVLDIGSMDINGNNRGYFTECQYTGIDVGEGPNVDVVCSGHLYRPDEYEVFDTIISTECLEHNPYWKETLIRAMSLLKHGGLLVMTCAGRGRGEHGTSRSGPETNPAAMAKWGDYYHNIEEGELADALLPESLFNWFCLQYHGENVCDLYFWGKKS